MAGHRMLGRRTRATRQSGHDVSSSLQRGTQETYGCLREDMRSPAEEPPDLRKCAVCWLRLELWDVEEGESCNAACSKKGH